MQRVLDRVCGMDVHRDSVAACIRVTDAQGGGREEIVTTFGTMTPDLLALRDWLAQHGVTHVAMESTGVFWKPVYYVLEAEFEVLLVNAAHVKNVPGRKTDVKDCQWLAQLLECGLLRASFVPPPEIRDLRDLTRYRRTLTHERAQQVQRLHKILQDAGIKLSSVASDITGVSGRAMIEALLHGTTDAQVLAELARGRLRAKLPELRRALVGRFRKHHAFLASEILSLIDAMEESIERVSQQIEEVLRPFAEHLQRLTTIPGVSRRTAEVLAAEIGLDMSRFPSAGHLASWAGLCPGNNESAGKHKSGRTRKGDPWLRTALVEAALAAMRKRNSYLGAHYRRVARRRGHKKAVIAVAHTILVIAYHVISREQTYHELGADYFEARDRERIRDQCVRRLARMGFDVALSARTDAA